MDAPGNIGPGTGAAGTDRAGVRGAGSTADRHGRPGVAGDRGHRPQVAATLPHPATGRTGRRTPAGPAAHHQRRSGGSGRCHHAGTTPEERHPLVAEEILGSLARLYRRISGAGHSKVVWCLLVLGQRPVDAGEAGIRALTAAGGDDQVGLDLFDGIAVRAEAEREHFVGDVTSSKDDQDHVPAASGAIGWTRRSRKSRVLSRAVATDAAERAVAASARPVAMVSSAPQWRRATTRSDPVSPSAVQRSLRPTTWSYSGSGVVAMRI